MRTRYLIFSILVSVVYIGIAISLLGRPRTSSIRSILNSKNPEKHKCDGNDGPQNKITLKSELEIKPRPRFNFKLEPEIRLNSSLSCNSIKANWKMVFFIKSAINYVSRRDMVRRTWASVSKLDDVTFQTIFVVGFDGNDSNILVEEQEKYNDILQYNGSDNYENIALKTLAGMQWASDNLPKKFFYSSGDDDFIYDLQLVKEMVETNQKVMTLKEWPEYPILCMYGVLPQPQLPHRHNTSKWKISKENYKWTKYPNSCLGGLYTTSVSVIEQLYFESRISEPLIVDDVWITGVLRNRLGMPDEMVISYTKTLAHHTGTDSGSTNVPQKIKAKWEQVYTTFNHKQICINPKYK